ncbi:MAG: hybrid sensor histidine kinase/response regulator [Proteobacteria bacterium]|nr:MAG: hybrid sensor histidine kinase/response regulator [Pseudomonadota bacterium]PIE40423.1 MAG: hybrid sensor histidine kinase/response regulator [Gammaproteobacteria bacterium]
MKSWGIKNRILLLAFLPAILISLLPAVYFTYSTVTDSRHLFQQKGMVLADVAAELIKTASSEKNEKQRLYALLNAWLRDPDIRSLSILSGDGSIMLHAGPRSYSTFSKKNLYHGAIFHSNHSHSRTVVSAISSINPAFNDSVPDVSAPDVSAPEDSVPEDSVPEDSTSNDPVSNESVSSNPVSAGQTENNRSGAAWITVEVNNSTVQVADYQHILISIFLAFTGLIVSTLFALKVGRDFINPIKGITQTLSDLQEGKLETRLAIESGPEMQNLAAGVNSLAESLNKAYEQMNKNVDQATEELRQTLETNKIQNIELNLARKQALEASRVKSEFLANMSHEIRTPLNGIMGFTNLLLKGYLSHTQRDHLLTIKKSSETLLVIINDILDFSKIEAGKLQLDHIPLDLKQVIEETLTMLAPSAHQKELELVAMVYEDVPENVFGDPLRLKQIIANLVSNAIKFTQRGDVIVRVMIETITRQKADIKITVTDTGVGLSRIQQDSLFSAFSQADASTARRYGGTGLGLVISKRLIEEMGGKIGVESTLGRGSTFWITLPCDVVTGAMEGPNHSMLSGERIIYCEPHDISRLAVSHMLEARGITVTHADSLNRMLDQVARAQSEQQGYAAAIIGTSKLELDSARLKSAVHELEFNHDCRTLVLTPTIDELGHPVLDIASAHLIKPPLHQRLYESLATLVSGKPAEIEEENQPPDSTPCSSPDKKPLILAVDDNAANLKLVEAFLDEFNIQVDRATSGFEALSKVKKTSYGLIFMDVQMPGMDGIETTRKIRQLDSKNERKTPIVALTAHALNEEKRKLLASGFDDFLTKPISETQLQEVIQQKTGYQAESYRRFDQPLSPNRDIKPSTKSTSGPCVDILASIRLAAGKPDLAEELFNMLLEHLIDDYEAIQHHFENDEKDQLMYRVHKLHGATRYCGVPELMHYTEAFETALKQGRTPLAPYFNNLMSAISRVRNWSDHNNWQAMFRGSS